MIPAKPAMVLSGYQHVAALLMLLALPALAAPDFRVGIELPSQVPVTKAVENGLRDTGISYVNYCVNVSDNEIKVEVQ